MAVDKNLSRLPIGEIGFPCNLTDGNYVFSEDTPSAAIIAAIEALPQTAAEMVSYDCNSLPLGIPLRVALSDIQYALFQGWQRSYGATLKTSAYAEDTTIMADLLELLVKSPVFAGALDGVRDRMFAKLTSAGFTPVL